MIADFSWKFLSNCWIFSVKFENWLKLREGKIWAAKRTLTKEKVKNGDDVAIYVIGTNSICGAYQIDGDWYSSKEPYWPDEVREGKVMYPHQVKLKVIQEGVANIEKLTSSLTFIENKKNRFVYFRGTPANFKRPIPASDYQKILEEMKENPLPTDMTKLLKRTTYPPLKPKYKVGNILMHPKHGRVKVVSANFKDGKWEYEVEKIA